jgi:hypothetical protein
MSADPGRNSSRDGDGDEGEIFAAVTDSRDGRRRRAEGVKGGGRRDRRKWRSLEG